MEELVFEDACRADHIAVSSVRIRRWRSRFCTVKQFLEFLGSRTIKRHDHGWELIRTSSMGIYVQRLLLLFGESVWKGSWSVLWIAPMRRVRGCVNSPASACILCVSVAMESMLVYSLLCVHVLLHDKCKSNHARWYFLSFSKCCTPWNLISHTYTCSQITIGDSSSSHKINGHFTS